LDRMRSTAPPLQHRMASITQAFGLFDIMPTVEKLGGLRCSNGPPELRENYGFSQAEVGRIKTALAKRLAHLCAAWKDIHGSL
jgi:hypothetical protein